MPGVWKCERWIAAALDENTPGRHILLGVEAFLFRERSPYQEVVIARLPELGLGLFLDAVGQFVEVDEFIYHEHLALVPLLLHPRPRRVLILGGGDGLALREVLRHREVEQVTLVELDALVIQACRTHLAALQRGSLDDPRAQVVIADARDFLRETPERFDVVLVDLVDPYGEEGLRLYDEVLSGVERVLAPGALVSTQGETIDPPYYLAARVHALLARRFPHVALHTACWPTFAGEWAFLLASRTPLTELSPQTLQARAAELEGPRRALVPERFPGAFVPAPHVRQALERARTAPLEPAFSPTFGWLDPPG